MTKQETFDIVVAHLRRQGCKSERGQGHCMYRGPAGRMCAAGILIPDDKYRSEMEGSTVLGEELGTLLVDLGHDLGLVSDLQYIHDFNAPKDWEARFEVRASDHGLKYTPVVA